MGADRDERDMRREWLRAMREKGQRAGMAPNASVRTVKGIGPNKACGHKGGICRQGSKRG